MNQLALHRSEYPIDTCTDQQFLGDFDDFVELSCLNGLAIGRPGRGSRVSFCIAVEKFGRVFVYAIEEMKSYSDIAKAGGWLPYLTIVCADARTTVADRVIDAVSFTYEDLIVTDRLGPTPVRYMMAIGPHDTTAAMLPADHWTWSVDNNPPTNPHVERIRSMLLTPVDA
jgi:hypothetical protein